MKKVRLVDVAARANVSKSTASQYLNGRYEYMSEATRLRIEAAIKELNFQPNTIARCLTTQKSYTIGIIVSDITGVFTSHLIRGVDDFCKSKNYNLLIYNTDYNKEVEIRSIQTLKSVHADGLILTSSGEISAVINTALLESFPVVHTHRSYDDLEVPTVLSDYRSGSSEAIQYLFDKGHRRVAIFTRNTQAIPSRRERLAGCYDTYEAAGITLDSELVFTIDSNEDIQSAFEKVLAMADRPTAVYSMYSSITMSLLDLFENLNISVPQDLSLIAFDDLPMAEHLKTPLTVIAQKSYELGASSARLLFQKIEHPESVSESVILPCDLIKRSSVKDI